MVIFVCALHSNFCMGKNASNFCMVIFVRALHSNFLWEKH